MALEVSCPGCSRRLSVPESAAGKQIKCPTCAHVFSMNDAKPAGTSSAGAQTSAGAPAPRPSSAGGTDMWHIHTPDNQKYSPVSKTELDTWAAEGRLRADFQLFRVGGDQWVPAAQIYPALAGGSAPGPMAPDNNPFSSPRDVGDFRPQRERYQKPHRGGQILTLGILGILCCGFLAIAAWAMGNGDLKEMAAGRMDRSGEGMTKAGMVLGIIGCVLLGIGVLIQIAGVAARH